VNCPVGHVPFFEDGFLFARDDEEAGGALAANFEVGIRGIGHSHTAIDGVAVGVEARRQGTYRETPDSLLIPLKGRGLLDHLEDARRSHQNNFARLRCEKPKSDGPIGVHLR